VRYLVLPPLSPDPCRPPGTDTDLSFSYVIEMTYEKDKKNDMAPEEEDKENDFKVGATNLLSGYLAVVMLVS
jgi:hypothetical protein